MRVVSTITLLAFLSVLCLVTCNYEEGVQASFVTVEDSNFYLNGKKYFFVGTNYWYGMNLGAPQSGNLGRLQRELDDLKNIGVTNLRIMGSTQGPDDKSRRIVPSLEYEKGKYNEDIWEGLDTFLNEMRKRNMKAVVTLSNFWEWSGGFGQIYEWYKGSFNRYPTSFYGDDDLTNHLKEFISVIVNRTNTVNGVKYNNDPTIMAWQLANEPRAGNCDTWTKWVNDTSTYIKELAPKQLVSIGNEGTITGCSGHGNKVKNIDYITFHAWAQNWGW
jgi:mannan endo-1,4-beta-mannosidase